MSEKLKTIEEGGSLLRPAEASKRLRVCERQVRNMIRRGELRGVRVCNRVMIDPADLLNFITQHKTAPAAA